MTIEKFNETCIKICEADQSLNAELYQIIHDWGYGYDMGTGFHPVPAKVLASAAIKAISYNYKPEILQSPFILTTECDDFVQKLLSMKYTLDPVRTEQDRIKYIEMKNTSVDDTMQQIKEILHKGLRPADTKKLSPIRVNNAIGQISRNKQTVNYDNKETTNMKKFIKLNDKKIEDATNTWTDGYIILDSKIDGIDGRTFNKGDIYCCIGTASDILESPYFKVRHPESMAGIVLFKSAEDLINIMPIKYLTDFSNLVICKVSAYVDRHIVERMMCKDYINCVVNDFIIEEVIYNSHDINEFINENNALIHVFEYFIFGNGPLAPDVKKITSKISCSIKSIDSFVSNVLLKKKSICKGIDDAGHTSRLINSCSSGIVLDRLLKIESLINRSIDIINMMADNGCTPSEIVTTFMNYKL